MNCNKHEILLNYISDMTSIELRCYQIQNIKIQICNKCDAVGCKDRLANKETLNRLIIPRRSTTTDVRRILEYVNAAIRVAPDNVLR